MQQRAPSACLPPPHTPLGLCPLETCTLLPIALLPTVWIGALGGVLVSILIGVIFIVIFYVAGEKLFSGDAQSIFKGVVSWIAALLITVVALHMLKFYNLERKWQRKLSAAMSREVSVDGERVCGQQQKAHFTRMCDRGRLMDACVSWLMDG